MDKLKMGDVTLQGSVHFTTARVAEQSVPALELRVEGPVDEAVLEAVKEGKLDTEGCNNCGRCAGKCPFGAFEEYQYGFKVFIGGRWGKKVAHGQPLTKIFTSEEEVMDVVEKAILLFRDEGISGERFADTINRLGFENVQAQLLSDEILKRKEAILAE